jgi:hypothetical protein
MKTSKENLRERSGDDGILVLNAAPCDAIVAASEIEHLSWLHLLRMDECPLSSLRNLARLTELRLESMKGVDLRSASQIPSLQSLTLSAVTDLKNLEELHPDTQIRRLCVMHCPNIGSLSGVEVCRKTSSLIASLCANLRDINALADLPLERCNLSGSPKIDDITSLFEINTLKLVSFAFCQGIPKRQILEFCRRHPDCDVMGQDGQYIQRPIGYEEAE